MWSYTEKDNFKAISSSYMRDSPVPVPIIKLVPSKMQEVQHVFCYFSVYVCAVGVRRERERAREGGVGVVAENLMCLRHSNTFTVALKLYWAARI